MSAHQMPGGVTHGRGIDCATHQPGAPRLDPKRRPARNHTVGIAPAHGRKSRVPVGRHFRDRQDRDGGGFQVLVEGLLELKPVPVPNQVGLSDLTPGVNAGIGPACRRDRVERRIEYPQRRLEGALNRGLIGLALPARKRRAVVFDEKGKAGHDFD